MYRDFLIISTIFYALLYCCGCDNEEVKKQYFTQPIEVVCDYPFNDTSKYAITCRVWGLLKYHHPNVTAGKLDWDEVLLERLDNIRGAQTPEQVNAEVMQMIRIAGKYKVPKSKIRRDSINMNVNLCWLDHSFINDTIKRTLKEITLLTMKTPSYYITANAINLPVPNEKDDVKMFPDYKQRLLGLFRYWNVIYYFYPYKYLMDQSWDVTLSEFIPQFINAIDIKLYHRSVQKLATRLNDGHAYTSVSIPYDLFRFRYITMVDTLTVVRTPLEGSLLERGDIILGLNGENIRTVRDSIAALIPSSNRRFTDNAVNGWLHEVIVDGCTLTILRNQQEITLRESRKTFVRESSPLFSTVSADIGYVNVDRLRSFDIPNVMNSLKDCKGIIFDLRNYPYHLLTSSCWDLICYISSKQEYCYGLANRPDPSHYGAFYQYECYMECPDELWEDGNKRYEGKVVALINASSISAAETLSMDFRIHGATLIGTPTAGANGNVVHFSLPGGIAVYYSGLGFYYPNGEQTQRTGIIPDIEVYPTMDDILAGRDEVLEAAIRFINSN